MTDRNTYERQLAVLFNVRRDIGLIAEAHQGNAAIQQDVVLAKVHIDAIFDEIARTAREPQSMVDVAHRLERDSERMQAVAEACGRVSTPPPTLPSEGIAAKKGLASW